MDWLSQLLSLKLIRPIDAQFAQFIAEHESSLSGKPHDQGLMLLALLLSNTLGQNNVCLALNQLDMASWFGRLEPELLNVLPPLNEAVEHITQYHSVRSVASLKSANSTKSTLDGANAPLVYFEHKLYLERYWQYEWLLSQRLKAKVSDPAKQQLQQHLIHNSQQIKQWFDTLFVHSRPGQMDWQKAACANALINDFCVITGGPGTGKTTTVTNLLALLVLIEKHNLIDKPYQHRQIIKLVTPTGKAAARLSESIKSAKSDLPVPQEVKQAIPDEASTIHRLLGVKPHSSDFIHHQDNLLHLDVLVVGEVSMVDLPMMAKLMSALPSHTKVILLGDKDQLASVEAGSVLADICSRLDSGYSQSLVEQIEQLTHMPLSQEVKVNPLPSFNDAICMLKVSYRFDDKSGIGQLAKAVNRGDWLGIKALSRRDDAHLLFAGVSDFDRQQLIQHCAQAYQPYLQMIKDGASVKDIINEFNRFQLLCAVREGDFGVAGMNVAIERQLERHRLIDTASLYYAGKPIMISSNDYSLSLFNGDIGLILPDAQTGQLKAWFITPDGEVKAVFPNRLPSHESVYAMTVHKSQGSEFDAVAMILPPASEAGGNKVITRELIYTGITRAKKRFALYAEDRVMQQAVSIATDRASGLGQLLYG